VKHLSINDLPPANSDIGLPAYKRREVESGIVHFGVGNFHRTHQAVYCDDLLCQGEKQWGITGVSLRSANIRDALAAQDFLYTLVTLGTNTTYRIIGSIKDILVAPENPAAVIDAVASNRTKIITTTITEKGYALDSAKIDANHPGIRHDMASLEKPQTIYGYLAAGIIKRCNNKLSHSGGSPLTIICCDNIQGGGKYLEVGVKLLLEAHCPESRDWTDEYIAFTSSMVDRVSPATDNALKHSVASHLDLIDEWPVAAAPFSQWIIEDNFAGERPPFDKVGALFVDDIAPYEQMKLRFLNAGHSMASALGYLAGDLSIHQALGRSSILDFVTQALVQNALPVTRIPEGYNGMVYIEQVLDRFHNAALPYAVLQVGTDSSQKIQQRWFPTIDDALAQDSDTSYLAFSLAAWTAYIQKALSCDELYDPLRQEFSQLVNDGGSTVTARFLCLAGAEKFQFFTHTAFMAAVDEYYRAIVKLGITPALGDFLASTAYP